MKRWAGILVLAFVFCVGCQKEAGQEGHITEWVTDDMNAWRTYGEQGVFYTEHNFLRFLDPQSGTDALICDNIECRHTKEECAAYFDGMTTASIEGDHLLLLTTYGGNSIGDYSLYETSFHGENRKKLASLRYMEYITKAIFTERYVIVSFRNSMDENFMPLDETFAGIYVYDKETRTGKTVWKLQKFNAMVLRMVCVGDEIFFVSFYTDRPIEEALEHAEDLSYTMQYSKTEFCKIGADGEGLQVIDGDSDDTRGMGHSGNLIFACYADISYQYDIVTGEYAPLSEKPLRPCINYLDDEMFFTLYIGNDQSEGYAYSKKDGLRLIGKMRKNTVQAVFPNYVYGTDYETETGQGEMVYWTTKDFLKGKFDHMKRYEKLD